MEDDVENTSPVNSEDMAMDDRLREQLSAFQRDSGSLADLFGGVTIQDCGAAGARDVRGTAASPGKKPLYIPNYVTSAVGVGDIDSEETELLSGSGASIILRGNNPQCIPRCKRYHWVCGCQPTLASCHIS